MCVTMDRRTVKISFQCTYTIKSISSVWRSTTSRNVMKQPSSSRYTYVLSIYNDKNISGLNGTLTICVSIPVSVWVLQEIELGCFGKVLDPVISKGIFDFGSKP